MFKKSRLPLLTGPFIFVSLIISTCLFAQKHNEGGFYFIKNFNIKEYKPQNWCVVQDSREIMYFGNNDGILEYDGESWRLIKTRKNSTIRSLAIDGSGTIYVGGTGEIGYLKPSPIGNLSFVPLDDFLPENEKEFADVWKTYATASGKIYFQTSTKIFCWDGKSFHVIKPATAFHFSYLVGDELYVTELDKGLKKVIGDSLVMIPGGEQFSNDRIYAMTPIDKDKILIITRKSGFFNLDIKSNSIIPFITNADWFFQSNPVYNCIDLGNGRLSIGTLGGGIAIINKEGELLDLVSQETSLQDPTIYFQFLDVQQNLWVALNNGISRIDINSPLTYFSDANGLKGTVQAIERFKGNIFAATNLGVFMLDFIGSGNSYYKPVFKQIEGISAESWDLLVLKNELLAATNAGIYSISDKLKSAKIGGEVTGNATVLFQSARDSFRIFVGLGDGLASIYNKDGKWMEEKKIKGLEDDIRTIAEERNGALWIGTNNEGVYKLNMTFQDKKIRDVLTVHYGKRHGLPAGVVYVKSINEKIYFGTLKGLYAHQPGINETKSKLVFIPDSGIGKQFADSTIGIHRIFADYNQSVWMVGVTDNSIFAGYVENKEWVTKPFAPISKDIVHGIFQDSASTWLGGPSGLFRFNGMLKPYKQKYYTHIRKVILEEDSLLYNGIFYNDSGKIEINQTLNFTPTLPYKLNSIIFNFSATDYSDESSKLYQYYLEGFDKTWSGWNNETKAVYTNLHEGEYFFKVRSKNIFDEISNETIYTFTILPPWNRTFWAYIGYVLFFAGFVYAAIVFSTRGLRAIINERTAEIVKQKEEIELKNKDITDSINYAKRIQSAILPPEKIVKKFLPESFIFFKPKDIVAGDFYFFETIGDKIIIAAADCTGHGVPGAMVSVVCSNALSRAVKEFGITEPGKILDKTTQLVLETFERSESEVKDGMDISLVQIEINSKSIKWAGANNPLWVIKKTGDQISGNFELKEISADKQPIGRHDNPKLFTTHTMEIIKGDTIFLFTDGYADQFGGPKGKKFKYKQFQELLIRNIKLPINEQQLILEKTINDWKLGLEQVDDILVMGIRV